MDGEGRRWMKAPPRDRGEPAREEHTMPELSASPRTARYCLNVHQLIPPLTIGKS
jgi:hypothetical protein